MHNSAAPLRQWTKEQIDWECRYAYRRYERELIAHYVDYFRRHQEMRCNTHLYSARTIPAALPPGYSHLSDRIAKGDYHRFCRSGRSSQMLALALLGAAVENDRSLWWLWSALQLPKRLAGLRNPVVKFEHCLAPADLNEVPRTTKLDLSFTTDEVFIAVETKWSEPGLGICSCAREREGDPRVGFDCAVRVRSRRKYWLAAQQLFGLESVRLSFQRCPISSAYQAIRTAAAVRHFAGKCAGVFVLVFDERNPYFTRTGNWAGWPAVLTKSLGHHEGDRFYVRAISWQKLIRRLPLSSEVRRWANEKHRLE